jgi:hypothetical protein
MPYETPASPLIELCLVDEFLSLRRSSRWRRKLAQVRRKEARKELAVYKQSLARKGLTPPLVGHGLKGLADPGLVERVSRRARLAKRIARVPNHVVTSEARAFQRDQVADNGLPTVGAGRNQFASRDNPRNLRIKNGPVDEIGPTDVSGLDG